MTTIASDLSGYGLAGRIGVEALSVAQNSGVLTEQATSGLITPQVAELGRATPIVLDLQPQLAELGVWRQNGQVAQARLGAASSALSQLQSITQTLSTTLLSLQGDSGSSLRTAVATAAQGARSMLGQVAGMLNTQAGDTYVFAGAATGTAPVPDAAAITSGPLSSAVATALGSLDTAGSTATLQSIVAATASTAPGATPFAAAIDGVAPLDVEIGPETSVPTASSITTPGTVTPSSTGSGARDLVAVLTAVANLSAVNVASPNFGALLSGLRGLATSAQTGLGETASANGAAQDLVTQENTINSTTQSTLSGQIADLTSVDAATVATELSASNQQLQASYQLIADLKGMTLAAYL